MAACVDFDLRASLNVRRLAVKSGMFLLSGFLTALASFRWTGHSGDFIL